MIEARKVHWVALELELQMIGNRPMDAGNFIQDPLKKQQLLLTAEPSHPVSYTHLRAHET